MGDHWTPAEILRAFEQLPAGEKARLRGLALFWIWRTDYTKEDDLLVTALVRLCDGGPYDRDIAMVALLCQKMRSLANSSRHSLPQRIVKTSVERSHLAVDPVEDVVIDEEETFLQRKKNQKLARKIRHHFREDRQVLHIIEGICCGTPAQQVREKSGMTKTQYNSAQRRFRRGLEKLFPGMRPSDD